MDDTNDQEPPPAPPELEELAPAAAPAQAAGRGSVPLAEWRALLHNRFILGGLGVLVVLFLVMVVLLVFSDGDGSPSRSVVGGQDSTPDSESTPVSRSGLVGNVRTTTTMRNGPGVTYAILGTIRKGALVSIIGRNADDTWLQVLYPPGSQIRGWVDASFIKVSGDVSDLAVAGPGAGPDVDIPTYDVPWVPPPTEPPPSQQSASPTSPSSPSPSRPTATVPSIPTVTPPSPPTAPPPATATQQRTPAPQSLPTETPAAIPTQPLTPPPQSPPSETPAA